MEEIIRVTKTYIGGNVVPTSRFLHHTKAVQSAAPLGMVVARDGVTPSEARLVNQSSCPICRPALPDGPEKLFDEAIRAYCRLSREVDREEHDWDCLPLELQGQLDRVRELYVEAAAQGHVEAEFMLAVLFDENLPGGQDCAKNDVLALEHYERSAKGGHTVGQFCAGLMFLNGTGVVRSPTRAIEYLEQAAAQGNSDAQAALGSIYYEGDDGLAANRAKAVEYFELAGAQGHVEALTSLGFLFASDESDTAETNGQSVVDGERALSSFLKAADLGGDLAQLQLGMHYAHGSPLATKDLVKARHFLQMAADQGHYDALFNLGAMCADEGPDQDNEKALECYREAAAQGHPKAMFNLGSMYGRGQGVARDIRLAKEWMEKAAAKGHEGARENLRIFEPDYNPNSIVGEVVEICGLRQKPELNGKKGRVVSFVPETQRYELKVEGRERTVALKNSNFKSVIFSEYYPKPEV